MYVLFMCAGYSFDNLTELSVGVYNRRNGGLCSTGFTLELKVNNGTYIIMYNMCVCTCIIVYKVFR